MSNKTSSPKAVKEDVYVKMELIVLNVAKENYQNKESVLQ